MPSFTWHQPKTWIRPTAQTIANGVIEKDEPLPTSEQFVECRTVDIAYALNDAAKTFVRKADAIMAANSATLDGKDATSANAIISIPMGWWKQESQEDVLRMGSEGDRDVMIGSLIMCLDNIKELEYEML